MLAVMDSSFLPKSGKATFGLDRFWNGCSSRVERGLEVSVVGLVDVETEVGYALHAQQTFAQGELAELTRMDQALAQLDLISAQLPPEVRYLAVDGAYSKEGFVTGAVQLGLEVIGKLRCDTNLRHLYRGQQKRRGRPRQYDGKVDLHDLTRLTFVASVQPELDLYTAVVWQVSLKRTLRLAYLLNRRHPERPCFVVLFSTDLEQDPQDIYRYYRLRFQIEFLFRDAKQFTGLQDCQARDLLKLEFHFNASFTALNLAKLDAIQQHTGQQPFVFSMASVKRRALNQHLLHTFIANLDLEPTLIKSHPNYSALCEYGTITT
jgi:DDE superfamily endonuclease